MAKKATSLVSGAVGILGICLGGPASAQGLFNPTTSVVVLSAASTNSQMVGPVGPHQLLEITALNATTTVMDLRLYDTAVAPTCSSAAGLVGNYILSGGTAPVVGSLTVPLAAAGKKFLQGIGICITGITTTVSNTDTANAVAGAAVNFTFAGN